MANQYVAWVNTQTRLAFCNPIGLLGCAVGNRVDESVAVAIGDLDAIERVVHAINATGPPQPLLEDLLQDPSGDA
ncbi:MAG: hypothetical protein ACN6O3_07245 [Comamonas sp.]